MKKTFCTISLICLIFFANGQGIFKREANWKDSKNGIAYEMNIWCKSAKDAKQTKALAIFKMQGNTDLLDNIDLVQGEELKFNISLKSINTEIQLEPGVYTFKLYHKTLGEKEFEIKLEKGQKVNIQLTVK
ncbi:hypothetical protein [Pedobacter sp.]|uniref:hypothetical protein n=1 Tax=Pedobacter sp. TaxID=1411316 RepID=UPI003C622E90